MATYQPSLSAYRVTLCDKPVFSYGVKPYRRFWEVLPVRAIQALGIMMAALAVVVQVGQPVESPTPAPSALRVKRIPDLLT
jgi:hypothetical protein